MKKVIAITGGIGSGKSVVSAVLLTMGFSVYDCDSRAKELMNSSSAIKEQLLSRFGEDVYMGDGTLNKVQLSTIIFNDRQALSYVNGVVHPVVKDDLQQWVDEQCRQPVFVETAILGESGLDSFVNEVWNVTAPLETRVMRVMKRNATTRDKVIERINSQADGYHNDNLPVKILINDGNTPLLTQIMKLID